MNVTRAERFRHTPTGWLVVAVVVLTRRVAAAAAARFFWIEVEIIWVR